MILLEEDEKKGVVKIKVNLPEDLWFLSRILHSGDIVSGTTLRVIDFGTEKEKKPVWIKLRVEKVKYMANFGSLRISGIILDGKPSELVPLGKYHSFDVKEGQILTIEKKWQLWEKEELRTAVEETKKVRAMVVLIDEKKAEIYRLSFAGFEFQAEIRLPSLDERHEKGWEEIGKFLRKDIPIIVAGPGFEKEEFASWLEKKGYAVRVYSVSYAEITALNELVEVARDFLKERRLAEEYAFLEEFKKRLAKGELVIYGPKTVQAVEMGAVESIAIAFEYLENYREVLEKAEKYGAKVLVIPKESPFYPEFRGFGILALLRFPVVV